VYKGAPSGHVGNLNESQQTALTELKERIQQFLKENPRLQPTVDNLEKRNKMVGEHDDVNYLRFLRARNFNVNASFNLLSEALKWRTDFHGIGVDHIPEESIQEEQKLCKYFHSGHDKEGRPCLYIKVRLHDKNVSKQEILEKHAIFMFEEINWKVLRPPIETSTLVFDMTNFSIQKNMDYTYIKFLVTAFESKYPETLGAALVVDAPWIFSACYKIIKPMLDPKTANKVHFVTKAELLDWIDVDQLIQELGGNCVVKFPNQ